MAKFERELRAKASETAKYLNTHLCADEKIELVDSSAYRVGNAAAYFMMYTKSGIRSGCRETLSLLVIGSEEGDCTVSAVSSGASGLRVNLSIHDEELVTSVERLMDSFGKKSAGG